MANIKDQQCSNNQPHSPHVHGGDKYCRGK